MIDDQTIGFADFSGNRQYISLGNLQHDDRVSLFFMDYPNRRRLKVSGHVSVIDTSDEDSLAKLALPGYGARIERGLFIRVAALDWNCPQHITSRYSEAEIAEIVGGLTSRITELAAKLSEKDQAR